MTTRAKTKKQRSSIDADSIGRNDPAYWAARAVYAIKNGDRAAESEAKKQLRRLGFDLRRVQT